MNYVRTVAVPRMVGRVRLKNVRLFNVDLSLQHGNENEHEAETESSKVRKQSNKKAIPVRTKAEAMPITQREPQNRIAPVYQTNRTENTDQNARPVAARTAPKKLKKTPALDRVRENLSLFVQKATRTDKESIRQIYSILEFYVDDSPLPANLSKRMSALELLLELQEPRVARLTLIEGVQKLSNGLDTPDPRLARLVISHLFKHGEFDIFSLISLFDLSTAAEILYYAVISQPNPLTALNAVVARNNILMTHLLRDISFSHPALVPDPDTFLLRADTESRIAQISDPHVLRRLAVAPAAANPNTFAVVMVQLLKYDPATALELFEKTSLDITHAIPALARLVADMPTEYVYKFAKVCAAQLQGASKPLDALAPLASHTSVWPAIVDGSHPELVTTDLITDFLTEAINKSDWSACVTILTTNMTSSERAKIDPYLPSLAVERLVLSKVDESEIVTKATKILIAMVMDNRERAVEMIATRLMAASEREIRIFFSILHRAEMRLRGVYGDCAFNLFLKTSPQTQVDIGLRFVSMFPPDRSTQALVCHINAYRDTAAYNIDYIIALLMSQFSGPYYVRKDSHLRNREAIATLCSLLYHLPQQSLSQITSWEDLSVKAREAMVDGPRDIIAARAVAALRVLTRLNRSRLISKVVNIWFLYCLTCYHQFEPVLRALSSNAILPQRVYDFVQLHASMAARPDLVARAIHLAALRRGSRTIHASKEIRENITQLLQRSADANNWSSIYWCCVVLAQLNGHFMSKHNVINVFKIAKSSYPVPLAKARHERRFLQAVKDKTHGVASENRRLFNMKYPEHQR